LKLKNQIFYFPGRYVKKYKNKNSKHPKTQITKKTLGWVFLKKPGFFPTLLSIIVFVNLELF
jgi:hypothetical protein